MKKFISIVLCFLIICSFGLNAFATYINFDDVSEADSRYATIFAVADAGIMVGRREGSFSPNTAVTWIETLAVAVRTEQYMKGVDVYGADEPVKPWYRPYIEYALTRGFITDVPEDIGKILTRGEIAMLMAQVLWSSDLPVLNSLPSDYFVDVSEDEYCYQAVYDLACAGAIGGVEEFFFEPGEFMSRADLAAVAARLVGLAPRLEISFIPPETESETENNGHSSLYIEGLGVDDVITYFAEVCLDTEYGDKVGGSLIRKWVNPIYYTVKGQPTARDMEVLSDFVEKVNAIENFPGMYPVESAGDLEIYFYDEMNFENLMGSDFVGSWGGVTFWYDGLHQIYSETICVRTDIPQDARDSIIGEEIYNGLGPVQDTSLRDDSLINQWSNSNYNMTQVDELILKLLYHPSITAGMDYAQCEAVIRQLYY